MPQESERQPGKGCKPVPSTRPENRSWPQENTARLMPHPKQQSEDENEDEDEKEEFAQAAETLQDSGTKNTKPDGQNLTVERGQIFSH